MFPGRWSPAGSLRPPQAACSGRRRANPTIGTSRLGSSRKPGEHVENSKYTSPQAVDRVGRCWSLQGLFVHIGSSAESRNPKKHGHLRAHHPRAIFGVRCSDHAGNSTSTRGDERRGQAGYRRRMPTGQRPKGARRFRWSLRHVQVKPVACFTLPDLAPRGAVRRVGPRPDPTRSAHIDEPGGMAIRPGDPCCGFALPVRAATQGGERKKNGSRKAPTVASRCGGRPPSHD